MNSLVISSLLLVLGCNAAWATDRDFLEALCQNKPVELISTNQLGSLVKLLDSSSCPDDAKAAITGLDALVREDSGDLCTIKKVDAIKSFYRKHLDNSGRPQRGTKVSKQLEKLALAYAMQINSECKVHMIHQLLSVGSDHLKSEDFQALDKIIVGPVDHLLSALTKPDEVTFPSDFLWILPDKKTKVVLQEHESVVLNAKLYCDRRFKPIYKPLVEPIRALSEAGFDLTDILFMQFETKYLKHVIRGANRWSRYIFTCELLDLVDLKGPLGPMGQREPQQIEYQPVPSGAIGTTLINKYDKKLIQKLKLFDSTKTETERAKDRLVELTLKNLAPIFDSKELDLNKFSFINEQIIDLLNSNRRNSRKTSQSIFKALNPMRRSSKSDAPTKLMKDIFKETGMTRKEIDEIRAAELKSLGLAI